MGKLFLNQLCNKDTDYPFGDYIDDTISIIKSRRQDLQQKNQQAIITANSPFEYYPDKVKIKQDGTKKIRNGVLLVHGLLDSPYSMRDLAKFFLSEQFLTRAVLLPGHGCSPCDLINTTWQDWLNTVIYGIKTLQAEVENIYLAGFSTGASLCLHYALTQHGIKGLFLFAPNLKLHNKFSGLAKYLRLLKTWYYLRPATDCTKYQAISFATIYQAVQIATSTRNLESHNLANTPVFMALSEKDRTIDVKTATDYFTHLTNPNNKLIYYAQNQPKHQHPKINYCCNNLIPAHAGIHISPENSYYNPNIPHDIPIKRNFTGKNPRYNPKFHKLLAEMKKFLSID